MVLFPKTYLYLVWMHPNASLPRLFLIHILQKTQSFFFFVMLYLFTHIWHGTYLQSKSNGTIMASTWPLILLELTKKFSKQDQYPISNLLDIQPRVNKGGFRMLTACILAQCLKNQRYPPLGVSFLTGFPPRPHDGEAWGTEGEEGGDVKEIHCEWMKILIVLCEGPSSDPYKIFSVIRSERISVGEGKRIWLPAVLDGKKAGFPFQCIHC